MKVKVAQSCPTLCDPMDYTVYEILQAKILKWVAIPFSTSEFEDLKTRMAKDRRSMASSRNQVKG